MGFDVETTSKLPTEARIVTASIIAVQSAPEPDVIEWLADPGIDIPAEATAIHGITTDHARSHGLPPGLVASEIMTCLTSAWRNGWPVVAYNAPYDLTVLCYELTRHGVVPPLLTPGFIIDPLVIDRHVDRYRPGKRTLAVTCEHYGIELSDAHTSRADALATLRLAWRLACRYPEIGDTPLTELQALQSEWYRESQYSFADYLRTTIVDRIREEAMQLTGDERAAKLADIPGVLERAMLVENEAECWPLRVNEGIDTA